MCKPNTFIVGAPKCGTTAMASYLSDHENVFMCTPKEPHHFVHEDMPNKSNYMSLDRYLNLFCNADGNHSIIAEASVWYLYSTDAIRKISEFNTNARIIAMLRRPDEMVYSMHSQAVVTLQEDITDFEQAWHLGATHRNSYSKHCKEPKLLRYKEIANYGEQLTHMKKYFSDNQIHIVFYDDFKVDTQKEYRKILEFLGLPQDGKQHFPKVNPNTQLRSKGIAAFLRKPPASLMSVITKLKSILRIEKLGLSGKLTSLNQKSTKRNILNEEIRLEIIDNYKNDINTLSELTNRDLSHWLH